MKPVYFVISGIALLSGSAGGFEPAQTENPTDKSYSVCDVLHDRDALSDRVVTITGTVVGDRHSLVLQGKECGEGIYLIHKWGQTDGNWQEFDRAVARRTSGVEKGTLVVTVQGVYRNRVPTGSGYVRQFQAVRVLKVGPQR
jgi:hypothetical protein